MARLITACWLNAGKLNLFKEREGWELRKVGVVYELYLQESKEGGKYEERMVFRNWPNRKIC
jgi:hypothetical protein